MRPLQLIRKRPQQITSLTAVAANAHTDTAHGADHSNVVLGFANVQVVALLKAFQTGSLENNSGAARRNVTGIGHVGQFTGDINYRFLVHQQPPEAQRSGVSTIALEGHD